MHRVDVTWTWKLESPLHCGTGVSRPGRADALVRRDEDGWPLIPGEAVKGALRMSAEQVAAWLGHPQDYGPDGGKKASTAGERPTPEPRCLPLALVFGGRAQAHFTPARAVRQAGAKYDDWALVAATAIERETGQAKDDTLRVVEVASPGVEFEAGCTVWTPDAGHAAIAETLVLAAICATESVGARSGVGWGRMRLAKISLKRPDASDPKAALAPERLNALKAEFREPATATLALPVAPASDGSTALHWYRIDIQLDEPTTIGRKVGASNVIGTDDSIPATTLRGALRAEWLRSGVAAADVARWLDPGPRWLPGLPAAGANGELAVPVPACFMEAKGENGFAADSSHGLHDLLGGPPPADADGEPAWRSVSARWMTAQLRETNSLRRDAAMHVARDYSSGSKRDGFLFSQEGMMPGRDRVQPDFIAHACLPSDAPRPTTVHLGKRTSAGNGRARLDWKRLEAAPAFATHAGGGTDVHVQLLTPALMRGASGHWLAALGPEDWARLAGLADGDVLPLTGAPGTHSAASMHAGKVASWMGPWGHSRAPVACIDAGSAWRLRCKDANTATMLRAGLGEIAARGLGERTHEGFGWLVVDPSWLGAREGRPGVSSERAEQAPDAGGELLRWPGCERPAPEVLETLLVRVRAVADRLGAGANGPLQELLRRAREASMSPDDVLDFCSHMAHREKKPRDGGDGEPLDKAGAWRFLREKPVRQLLDQAVTAGPDEADDEPRRQRLRFVLHALLLMVPKGKE